MLAFSLLYYIIDIQVRMNNMVESLVIDRIIEILNNNISVDKLINLDIVDNSKISKEDSIL